VLSEWRSRAMRANRISRGSERVGHVAGSVLPDAAALHREVIVQRGLGILTMRAEGIDTGCVVARCMEGLATPAARDEGHRDDSLCVTPIRHGAIIVRAFY